MENDKFVVLGALTLASLGTMFGQFLTTINRLCLY